jgi:hypothetical protein
MLFAYKVAESSIKGTGFTAVPSLDFSTPTPVSGTATAIDGNAAANRAVITSTFTLDSYWQPGQTLTIRWNDVDETGTDDGMAIDSLTFSAEGPSTPLAQDSAINFSNILTTSMDVNWSNGDATSRIVVMNTSNSFTNPVDGNSYTANNVYAGSGQQIIYNGSGSTVNVVGLTASTNYFFRVFAYNGSSTATKYNTATALQNPNSQTSAAPQFPTKIIVTSLNGEPSPSVPISHDTLPSNVSINCAIVMRDGIQCGLMIISGIIPDAVCGISSGLRIIPTVPF